MKFLDKTITARERDLGGFSVRRLLPHAQQPMVGPFIFFDHMGPATFPAQHGIDVRPHPHIHLATVTYLFEGKIHHRDSLGSDQLIEPGAINWMTAGHGIVHSERTPDALRHSGSRLSGIQCWVALPEEAEDVAPQFIHYPAHNIPDFYIDHAHIKLLLGQAYQRQSPVKTHSELFYLEVHLPRGQSFTFPHEDSECAVYVVQGAVRIGTDDVSQFSLAIAHPGQAIEITALQDAHIMLFGGKPIGKRYIYWNFVASSPEKIALAKIEWAQGPGAAGSRFPIIANDHQDYIPLPEDPTVKNPQGTIM